MELLVFFDRVVRAGAPERILDQRELAGIQGTGDGVAVDQPSLELCALLEEGRKMFDLGFDAAQLLAYEVGDDLGLGTLAAIA